MKRSHLQGAYGILKNIFYVVMSSFQESQEYSISAVTPLPFGSEQILCGGFQNGSGSHVVHDDRMGLGGHDGHNDRDYGHDGDDGHVGHDGHDGHGQHLPTGENVHCGSRPRPRCYQVLMAADLSLRPIAKKPLIKINHHKSTASAKSAK